VNSPVSEIYFGASVVEPALITFALPPCITDRIGRDIQLKPYVHVSTIMKDKSALFGKLPRGGLNGAHYLKMAKAAELGGIDESGASFIEEPQEQKL